MDKDVRAGVTILFSMLAGVLIAAVEYELDAQGVFIDEFTASSSTIVVADLMVVTVLIFTIVGVILAAWRY